MLSRAAEVEPRKLRRGSVRVEEAAAAAPLSALSALPAGGNEEGKKTLRKEKLTIMYMNPHHTYKWRKKNLSENAQIKSLLRTMH